MTLTSQRGALQGHSVHNIQRLVATVDGAETTDDNRVGSTGVARGVLHLQTGNLTAERTHRLTGVCSGNVLGLHLLGGITERLLLAGNTHGGDYHLLEGGVVFLQGNSYITLNRNDL